MQNERSEFWQSRRHFILAAVGSAVGLGNIWRFPYIAYANGGGVFLIPYFVALFTAGIPILILEFALGQKMQKGAPGAFASIDKNFEGVGWWAVITALIITMYYSVVMAWVWDYLWSSLTLAWGHNPTNFFYHTILKISSGPIHLQGFSLPVIIGLLLTWLAIYFSIRRGVKTLGKIVEWTVTIPVIMLLILLIRGLTLPGSLQGIKYLFHPDFSKLKDISVWISAYAQIFFSMSLGFGVMIAYASYNPRKSDVTNNALITAFANSAFSFIAGITVFSVLGYLAFKTGKPVASVVSSGPGLAFITYPTILSNMPFARVAFSIIFFVMLLTLGIDSAFSLVEAFAVSIHDKWHIKKSKAVLITCIVGFSGGLLFATKAGLYWLDIVDHFITNYGLVVIGLTECVIIGMVYHPEKLRAFFEPISEVKIGAWWDVLIKLITPLILSVIIVQQAIKEFSKPYGGYAQWALNIGWAVVIIVPFIGFMLGSISEKTSAFKLISRILFSIVSISILWYLFRIGQGYISMFLFGGGILFAGLYYSLRLAIKNK